MGIADHKPAVAVERRTHAARFAVLGDEINLSIGHIHILQHIADLVIIDLLVYLLVITAVLIEIDD